MSYRLVTSRFCLLIALLAVAPEGGGAANPEQDRVQPAWLLPGGVGCRFDQALEEEVGGPKASFIPANDPDRSGVQAAFATEEIPSSFNPLRDLTRNPLRHADLSQPLPPGPPLNYVAAPPSNPVRAAELGRNGAIARPADGLAAQMPVIRLPPVDSTVNENLPAPAGPPPTTAQPAPPPRATMPMIAAAPATRPAPAAPSFAPVAPVATTAPPAPQADAQIASFTRPYPEGDSRNGGSHAGAVRPGFGVAQQIPAESPIVAPPAERPAATHRPPATAGQTPAMNTAMLPANSDISALVQPLGRDSDPVNAALARSAAMPSPVRYASQEDPLPAPTNGPAPTPEIVPTPAPFEVPVEGAGMPVVMEMAPPPERLMHLYRMVWGGNTQDPHHDHGIGYERVQYAPYIIDTVLPMNQYGLRIDSAFHWRSPDLGELVVARPQALGGTGMPLPESRINYQDIAFVSEIGTESFSTKTIIPLRMLDAAENGDTDGMGDMELDTKLVMLKGDYIKIAQFMGFHFNTGNSPKGLGTGHISIEPGMLASLKCSDETYLHGQLKFLFPTAANPQQKSNLLTWGLGVSHVLYDYDSFAVIPSIEAVFYSVLDGGTVEVGPPPAFRGSDWVTVPTIHYGIRMMTDRVRDLGLIEFGLSGGFSLGSNVWYEDLLRAEVRVVF